VRIWTQGLCQAVVAILRADPGVLQAIGDPGAEAAEAAPLATGASQERRNSQPGSPLSQLLVIGSRWRVPVRLANNVPANAGATAWHRFKRPA
jgi:hypothetical protein